MTIDINRVELEGNLGWPPVLRRPQSGSEPSATLSLATNFGWTDRQGACRSRTDWIAVVVLDPALVETCRTLAKGARVRITGRLETRRWKPHGALYERSTTEVVLRPGASTIDPIPYDTPTHDEERNRQW